MNKTSYFAVRRSIRDNGLTYTTHYAQCTNNVPTLEVCDFVANSMRSIDWLAMRQMFARNEKPSIAFKLTTPLLERVTQ